MRASSRVSYLLTRLYREFTREGRVRWHIRVDTRKRHAKTAG
jgi:hypothetical protein